MKVNKLRLGQVCDLKQWKHLPTSKLNENGKYLVYGANGVIGKYNEYNHEAPTIAITCRGASCGNIHLTKAKSYITSNSMSLDNLDKNTVNIHFLKFALKDSNFKKIITGSAQPQITRTKLKTLKIPILPLAEQQKIASFLTRIEALIQKREESIQRLDELIKSTFLNMFGDPYNNKYKFPIFTIGTLASDVKYGTSAPANNNGVYPYLRMNNIDYNGFWNFKDLKYINVDDAEKDKYLLKKGDIVFNRTNSRELVGKTAVYNKNSEMIIAGYLIRVRTNDDANPWFIWGYLNSKIGKSVLFDLCNSIVGMANINATKLKAIKIQIPPKLLQDKFASIVTKIEATKEKYQSSLEELNNLFNSTAQKAFNGELNLGNIEVIEKEISKEEVQMLDEVKILELIQSGSFEAKDYVNKQQSYDDIRDMVLKLIDKGKIIQKFTDDKKMVLEAITQ